MANKIWKRLTYNWGLKLVSLFFAIALWLVVVNVEDPEMTSTFTVAVEVINENYLANNNKTYEILDGTDTIRVSVTAKRSIITELSGSDLLATADLTEVEIGSEKTIQQIPIEVTSRRYTGRTSINARNYFMKVEVDNRISKDIPVRTRYVGTAAEGFTVGSITSMPDYVTVSGPQATVEKIEYATVTVDISGAVEDFDTRLTPEYFDEDDQAIDDDAIVPGVSDVTVFVEILGLKQVPITVTTIGTPAEGYAVDTATIDTQTILVKGTEENLANFNEILVNDVNVEGLSEATDIEVSLLKYLPNGVKLISAQSDKHVVHVTLKDSKTVAFTMPTNEISVTGLAETQKAAISGSTLSFTAYGDPKVMDELESTDFTASMDLAKYTKAGTYQAEVKVVPKDAKDVNVSPVYVTVVITGDAPEAEEDTSEGAEDTNSDDTTSNGATTNGATNGTTNGATSNGAANGTTSNGATTNGATTNNTTSNETTPTTPTSNAGDDNKDNNKVEESENGFSTNEE